MESELEAGGTENLVSLCSETEACPELPHYIREIEDHAFENSGCEMVVVRYGCERIGERAFVDCKNLQRIVIPSSVTSIAPDAFDGSGQAEIAYNDIW